MSQEFKVTFDSQYCNALFFRKSTINGHVTISFGTIKRLYFLTFDYDPFMYTLSLARKDLNPNFEWMHSYFWVNIAISMGFIQK